MELFYNVRKFGVVMLLILRFFIDTTILLIIMLSNTFKCLNPNIAKTSQDLEIRETMAFHPEIFIIF